MRFFVFCFGQVSRWVEFVLNLEDDEFSYTLIKSNVLKQPEKGYQLQSRWILLKMIIENIESYTVHR